MIALPLLVVLLSGQICGAPSVPPRVKSIRVGGDSRTLNGCVAGGTGPMVTLDAILPGGASGGYLLKNLGVSGSTPAQIAASYFDTTPGNTRGESVACNGERCGHLLLQGGVNCMRAGTAAATCFADMLPIVDDALSKGEGVVWANETGYAGWASAGPNPVSQQAAFNALWTAACAARASNTLLKCLNLSAVLDDPANPGYLLPANSCDGVHYSQVGMDAAAAAWKSALLSIP